MLALGDQFISEAADHYRWLHDYEERTGGILLLLLAFPLDQRHRRMLELSYRHLRVSWRASHPSSQLPSRPSLVRQTMLLPTRLWSRLDPSCETSLPRFRDFSATWTCHRRS